MTESEVTVPAAVAAAAGGRPVTLVWQNAGGLTFEVAARDGAGRRFIKWAPAGSYLDLAAEAARMTWARSAEWNYGPGWDGLLLDSYGVPPDPERTRYYRLLWDLSS